MEGSKCPGPTTLQAQAMGRASGAASRMVKRHLQQKLGSITSNLPDAAFR